MDSVTILGIITLMLMLPLGITRHFVVRRENRRANEKAQRLRNIEAVRKAELEGRIINY